MFGLLVVFSVNFWVVEFSSKHKVPFNRWGWCLTCHDANLNVALYPQLELITELLGTPSMEDMRHACDGARTHMLRRVPKQPSLSALYTLSSHATHEAVHLLCQMLVFDPVSFKTINQKRENHLIACFTTGQEDISHWRSCSSVSRWRPLAIPLVHVQMLLYHIWWYETIHSRLRTRRHPTIWRSLGAQIDFSATGQRWAIVTAKVAVFYVWQTSTNESDNLIHL